MCHKLLCFNWLVNVFHIFHILESAAKVRIKNGTAKSVLSIGILGGAIIGLRELTFGGEPVLTQF